MRFNLHLSLALVETIKPVPKQCYHNSMQALQQLDLDPRWTEDIYYCEGFAMHPIIDNFPFLHGWLETGDQVIDISPPWLNKAHNQNVSDLYHAVLRLDPDQFASAVAHSLQLPLQASHQHPDFLSAFVRLTASTGLDLSHYKAQHGLLGKS